MNCRDPQRPGLVGARRGVVVVGVQCLLIEIHVQTGLFAFDDHAQVVRAHAGNALPGFDELDALQDLIELARVEQALGGVAVHVNAGGAFITALWICEKPPASSIRTWANHWILPPHFQCSKIWELSSIT